MAPPEGLEPSTHELTARCSTELSYDGSINYVYDVANLQFGALFKSNRPKTITDQNHSHN